MATLSTHVLDTAVGRPAVGVRVTLESAAGVTIGEGTTDADGRLPAIGSELGTGDYRLRFDTSAGVPERYDRLLDATLPWAVGLALVIFALFRLEQKQWRYAGHRDHVALVQAVVVTTLAVAGLIALGSVVGGQLGATVGRRLPPTLMRAVIAVVGITALVVLLV